MIACRDFSETGMSTESSWQDGLVDEGPVFELGTVQITRDVLEVAQLLKRAAFKTGKLAN